MKLCAIFLLFVVVSVEGWYNRRDPLRNPFKKEVAQKDAAWVDFAMRCHGQDGCCTDDNPCGLGDGDCDYDDQCARDMVCGESNCKFAGGGDCCEEQPVSGAWAQCALGKMATGDGVGDYEDETAVGYVASMQECVGNCAARRKGNPSINGIVMEGLYCWCEHQMYQIDSSETSYKACFLPKIDSRQYRCQGSEDGCCTENNPCGEGDGDCDTDDECSGNLVCGNSNCAWGKGSDCCMLRHAGDQVKQKEPVQEVKKDEKKVADEAEKKDKDSQI